jgi:branched-chain amino acid transport system permease protein
VFGILVTGPEASPIARYYVVLVFLSVFALAAKNMARGHIGRSWMAIRDMDIAAEIIGIRPLQTKLMAFGISSFYCGVAGALYIFCWLGSAETEAFDILNISFPVLFMVIIGGLGSVLGSILGAGFITLLPIFLTNAPPMIGIELGTELQKHIEEIIFGLMIIGFLIVEPAGFNRLWQIAKEKLRKWPFPY